MNKIKLLAKRQCTKLLLNLISTLLLMIFPIVAQCKNLYVQLTGNDDVTYEANTIGTPWQTVGKAFVTAKPGDTVYFREGTYHIVKTIGDKFSGQEGTVSAPITFTCYNKESVTISGTGLDLMFDIERDFYVFDKLNFIGGGKGFRVAYDTSVDGFKLINCTYKAEFGGDNFGFVILHGKAVNAIIQNCYIQGPGMMEIGIHPNTSGIIAFRSEGVRIINCEIFNVPIGIYYKHANQNFDSGIEVAYNYIHHCDRYGMELNCNYAKIHNNVLGANCAFMRINEANGLPGGDYNEIKFNTFTSQSLMLFYDTQLGDLLPGAYGNKVYGNIFTRYAGYHHISQVPHGTTSDFNLFPAGTVVQENKILTNLDEWRSRSGQDGNSISDSVLFTENAEGVQRYALPSNSPGFAAGPLQRNLGADIRKVGYLPPDVPRLVGVEVK